MNYKKRKQYIITVAATDDGVPPQTGYGNYTISASVALVFLLLVPVGARLTCLLSCAAVQT